MGCMRYDRSTGERDQRDAAVQSTFIDCGRLLNEVKSQSNFARQVLYPIFFEGLDHSRTEFNMGILDLHRRFRRVSWDPCLQVKQGQRQDTGVTGWRRERVVLQIACSIAWTLQIKITRNALSDNCTPFLVEIIWFDLILQSCMCHWYC